MREPRRIFRKAAIPRPRLTRPVLLAAAALAAAGGAVAGLSSELFGRTTPGPERMSAEAAAVTVVDGGTLRLGTQVVRLRGVDAPSRLDSCRGGQDCGGAAAAALAALVRGRRVDCRLTSRDGQGRPLGTCEANGADLSRAIVASGWARAGADGPGLADLELQARQRGAGLWMTRAD
ncbi:MAG TPA: thermonuclease family protein [Acetobacteraceae bacterium]